MTASVSLGLFAGVLTASVVFVALLIESRRSAELRTKQTAIEQSYEELAARNMRIESQSREIAALRLRLTSASRSIATELIQLGGLRIPRMVDITSGSFLMGKSSDVNTSSFQPEHHVTIHRAFRISKFEITFSQYDQFAAAVGKALPDDEGWGRERRPVINVTWDDAVAYAKWLTDTVRAVDASAPAFRLPTEAEWEYVARAGRIGRYGPSGIDESNLCMHANYDHASLDSANIVSFCPDTANAMTAPVGTYPPSAFDVNDMIGNVAEWVADCWNDNYVKAPVDGSALQKGMCGRRVVRGGSWFDDQRTLGVYLRGWNHTGFRDPTIGFRVLQELK